MSPPPNMSGYHYNNIASSSSNPYPNFSHVNPPIYPNTQASIQPHERQYHHHQQSQSHAMHSMTHNQWPSGMRQNSVSHVPTHPTTQNQPYNHPAWANINQVLPQQFSNGMPNVGGFTMPIISQQIMQDAFFTSASIEPSDEKLLLQALVDSRNKRETYKDALNSLHGKNGHSASLWKDHYLDHKDRLDETISIYLNPPKVALQTIKKPSPSAYKQESSPVMPSRALPKRQTPLDHHAHRPVPSSGGRRSTINSLTAPAPVFDDRLPPPNAEIQIPDPPSRSPTPPSRVIPHRGRGNKYTSEDREFFLKFISWRLKCDPSLTRNDLCALLAAKAPHHTSQSWASHWSNRHDVPDKILAAAKGDGYDSNDESESEEEEKVLLRRRPKYRDPSSDEDSEEEVDSTEQTTDESVPADDDEPIQTWSESEMGTRGGPFTEADFYVTAKYIASFPGFDEASAKDRWQPYSERFPQRSAKSWAEYYRRNETMLQKLVRKIRKQDSNKPVESSSVLYQRAQPTWALREATDHLQKRKHDCTEQDTESEHDNEGTPGPKKRGRGEAGDV